MNYWIFQGNPDVFGVTEYLSSNDDIVWSVRQRHLAENMHLGDEVFLWRAAGKGKAVAGVVAVARLTGEPTMMPDDPAAHQLWKEGDPTKAELRVELTVEKRCLGAKETVRRDWIEADPELSGLRITKMRSETNYRITAAEAKRLVMLCRSVGSAWSRDEGVAALWAFSKTENGPVSKLAGAPVAQVAALIGRPVSGVYSKVMNFRHFDPRDPRKDLASINESDREAWAEFYDSALKALNAEALGAEFCRVWQKEAAPSARPHKYGGFGEAPDDDPSELAAFAAKVRKGQPKFRANMLMLYEDRCAISGWGPPDVLEAAHICAHAESGVNHSSNGILIRADLHHLMDAGLLQIDPETLGIQLDDMLRDTEYWRLNGRTLRPRADGSHPSSEHLRSRFA